MLIEGIETIEEAGHLGDFYLRVLQSQAIIWLLSINVWEKKEQRNTKPIILLIGLSSLFWFLFRTGTKPTRATYPCQRAAAKAISMSTKLFLPAAFSSIFLGFSFRQLTMPIRRLGEGIKRYWKPIVVLFVIISTAGVSITLLWNNLHPMPSGNSVNLFLTPQTATSSPTSDIYVLNGLDLASIPNLINLMGSHGLDFYHSITMDTNQGPSGLIAYNDVVLIKINSQWAERGGTNTDLLRQLIQAILNHPDGFEGEIVIADNGQGFGSLDWSESNAENPSQSVANVVQSFSSSHPVNLYDWQTIRGNEVQEYSDGDMEDGYILYDLPDPETGIHVTYPKFQTTDGTYISFKYGVWNGTSFENRLKVINFPILKSHLLYGITGAVKHYMGVESEGQANPGGLGDGHFSIADGGMGTLLAETRYPILNIMDAIWVNANPWPSVRCGPSTSYEDATRVNVLMASIDPIALDYWSAKHVLVQAAELIGYDDVSALDPDSSTRGILLEAFGVWLRNSETELIQNGFNVTCNESRMNVHVIQPFGFSNDLFTFSITQKLILLHMERRSPSYNSIPQCYNCFASEHFIETNA
ncbi:MAG: DUF362 domain-containing protein [Promethearchaeota archaeon]